MPLDHTYHFFKKAGCRDGATIQVPTKPPMWGWSHAYRKLCYKLQLEEFFFYFLFYFLFFSFQWLHPDESLEKHGFIHLIQKRLIAKCRQWNCTTVVLHEWDPDEHRSASASKISGDFDYSCPLMLRIT